LLTKKLLMKTGVIVDMELGDANLSLVTGERAVAILSVRLTQFNNWIWLRGVGIGWRWPPVRYLARFVNMDEDERGNENLF
jgi:hypothetical protein